MLRLAPLLLVAGSAGIAAPIPPPTEKEQIARHWGQTNAPSGDYQFKLHGKALTIRTAGEPVRGLIQGAQVTMPRVTRTITDDFEMTVKVAAAAAPTRDPKHQDAWPTTRAGLFVSGGGYGVEWHLSQYYLKRNGVMDEQPTRCVWIDSWFPGGGAGNSLSRADPNKPTYLRVTRKEKVVSVSYSFDGKEWSVPYAHRKYEFPDEVTVGVFLAHSTHQIADATFAEYTIEKPAKK